jgi:hypothetical protein
MADYKLAAQFVASKVGKTGIAVTVDVYRLGTSGAVASNQNATELGLGVYVYTHADATDGDYFGIFKTADSTVDQQQIGSWAALEIPRLDAAVSSRLADADWVTGLASILAAIAGIPALVWSVASRTLTMTAAQVQAALTGSTLTITNRVTFSQEISNLTIPATWSKIFVTFKKSRDYPDAAAALQWVVSNPSRRKYRRYCGLCR